ncbi:MAG: rod shape-determining protein MreD [Oceanicoccus sp.]|jgi:rod shape-determining protein MreD
MAFNNSTSGGVVVVTLVLALLLAIVPLPTWAQWGRPEWVAMVLLYWVIALPEKVGITVAWFVGLIQDVVVGAPIGQHAFALAILAYLALILYQRLRMYTPVQQAAVIFVLIGLNQMLGHWIQTISGTMSPNLLFLLPALVSALLWPILAVFLRLLRRAYAY